MGRLGMNIHKKLRQMNLVEFFHRLNDKEKQIMVMAWNNCYPNLTQLTIGLLPFANFSLMRTAVAIHAVTKMEIESTEHLKAVRLEKRMDHFKSTLLNKAKKRTR